MAARRDIRRWGRGGTATGRPRGNVANQRRAAVAARRAVVAALLTATLGVITACTGGDGPAWRDGGADGPNPDSGPKIVATISSPADKSDDVPAAAEITFGTENATSATVALQDAAGTEVTGFLREDGKTWVPDKALKYRTKYTATVTATGADGKTATTTSSFTTMAKPGKTVRSSSFLGDDMVVGVGMPIILDFGRPIPKDFRDDVQRRLFVNATPPQEGAWSWISGTSLRYRPKVYWKANTKISYRVALAGLHLGDGWYGRSDYTVDFKVGSAVVMVINDKTHRMTVTKDGKVVRTIPISLGRPSMPSSSGTTLIIQKHRNTVFDTMNDPNPANRYRTPVEYAQRLTWGGEFIHAAPWSVGDQGRRNVSHGCVNMSMANAAFLFNLTNPIGDPVITRGTPRKLEPWNGWTDWNISWADWIKKSAIPYEPPATPEPTTEPSGPAATPEPSASAAPTPSA